MSDPRLFVMPASAYETSAVMALLDSAAQWLLDRGIDQWHPGQWGRDRIADAIDRGETFIARLDGHLVGTISFQRADDFMWPDAADDAGYVHRLAMSVHGQGLGHELLEWAEGQIAEQGRLFARLDCACNNPKLRRYYANAGYRYIGDRTVRAGTTSFCGSRYEKRVRS